MQNSITFRLRVQWLVVSLWSEAGFSKVKRMWENKFPGRRRSISSSLQFIITDDEVQRQHPQSKQFLRGLALGLRISQRARYILSGVGDDENHSRREYKKPRQFLDSDIPLEARVNGVSVYWQKILKILAAKWYKLGSNFTDAVSPFFLVLFSFCTTLKKTPLSGLCRASDLGLPKKGVPF